MVITFIALVIVGLCIGVLSGLLGVGGGVIMVPLFRLVFGLSPVGSTATSLFTIIPTSVSGAVAHLRGHTCVPKLGVALGLGGACTSWIGVQLAQISPGWLVMVCTAIVIAYSAYTMLKKALKIPKTPRESGIAAQTATEGEPAMAAEALSASAAASTASEVTDAPSLTSADLVKAAAIGAVAGVASGYVGLGGGFIMVPLMTSVLGMSMQLASGTSLIAVMLLAMPATVLQCVLGNVDYLAGIAVACGSVPGAMLGARLLARVPERSLRLLFSAFLGIASILLVARELGIGM